MTDFGISTAVFGDVQPGAREFDLAASHGFRLIEIAAGPGRFDPRDPAQAARVRAIAAGASMEIAGLSVALADALPALATAAEMACPVVIARAGACPAHGIAAASARTDLPLLRRAIEPAAERAAELGIALAIAFPLRLRADDALAVIESLDGAAVGVCLDTGHAHLADGVPEAIETLAGYIHAIHLHDNQGREDAHRPPFAGSIDWPAVLMELEKTGYAGRAVFELAADPDAATAVARAVGARARLRAILDDLAQPMVFPE